MQLWENLLGNSMRKIKEKDLFEKAVIAEAIKNEVKKEYCFLSAPLEAAVRSEGIAVATASLIQEMGCNKSLNKALERGAQIYDDRSNKKSGLIIEENNMMQSRTLIGKLHELIGQQNKEVSINIALNKSKEMGLEM